MSGKPQYDEAEVVGGALDAFWRHGYSATSINVLTEATGLSRSSIYQRFGDKDGLFQIALAAYTERVMRRMTSSEGATARERLESLLRGLLPSAPSSASGAASAAQRPPGCLIARSCAELVDLPPESQKAVLADVTLQREALLTLLKEGVTQGELPADADVDALGWYFLGVFQAILNLPQAGAGLADLDRTVSVAMSAWPERSRTGKKR